MALPGKDRISRQPFEAGEPPSASVLNAMAAAAFTGGTGANCFVSGAGVFHRQKRTTPYEERYGKTDDALEEGESVTVSLWNYDADSKQWKDTDEDQEDVYDSFWYQGLTLPKGVMVTIRYTPENSRWEIVYVPDLVGITTKLKETSYTTVRVTNAATNEELEYVYGGGSFDSTALPSGTKVTLRYNPRNQRWEIIQAPRRLYGVVTELHVYPDASVVFKPDDGASDEDSLNVGIPHDVPGGAILLGAKIAIEHDEQNGGWRIASAVPLFYKGTLTSALSIGGTATARVSGIDISDAEITVRDRFMSVAGDSIASGKTVAVSYDVAGQEWIVTSAPCS